MFCVMLLAGVFQVLGIASVFPFMAVLTNPELVETNRFLLELGKVLNLADQRSMLVFLGAASFAVLVTSNLVAALNLWLTFRFVATANCSMSVRLLQYYLSRHYLYHVESNTADITKNLIEECYRMLLLVVVNVLQVISRYVSITLVVIMLVVMDPVIAVIAMGLLGGLYITLFSSVRRRLFQLGQENSRLFSERYQIANESLGGIKDLLLMGRTAHYQHRFSEVFMKFRRNHIFAKTIAEVPRFLLEILAFGAILLMAIHAANKEPPQRSCRCCRCMRLLVIA